MPIEGNKNRLLFANSVHTSLVSPLDKQPFFITGNWLCCTFSRDLIRDALVRERKRKKSPPPSGTWTHNLLSICSRGALDTLCYNRFTKNRLKKALFLYFKLYWKYQKLALKNSKLVARKILFNSSSNRTTDQFLRSELTYQHQNSDCDGFLIPPLKINWIEITFAGPAWSCSFIASFICFYSKNATLSFSRSFYSY